jgi:hypothetical protein
MKFVFSQNKYVYICFFQNTIKQPPKKKKKHFSNVNP